MVCLHKHYACANIEKKVKIMYIYLDKFIDYMQTEKNAAILTVKYYKKDIQQFLEFLAHANFNHSQDRKSVV